MRALCLTLAALAFAAGCDDPKPVSDVIPVNTPKADPVKPAAPPPTKSTVKPKRPLPTFPALTEESARAVLHASLDDLAGDDMTRDLLLYHVDLGDRAAVNKIHEHLLRMSGTAYEDATYAAVGVEALLAYGEADAGKRALQVAKQYASPDEGGDPDEFVAAMLGRVDGAEKAEALRYLVEFAGNADEECAVGAVQELARMGAREAGEAFMKIVGNPEFGGAIRGAAAAGLLHSGDARAKAAADALLAAAASDDGPEPEDVVLGLGVVGAVEAAPYVRQLTDTMVERDDVRDTWVVEAAASAMEHIFRGGGGAEYVAWWRALGARPESMFEDEVAKALFNLGDDSSIAAVARIASDMVASGWDRPATLESVCETFDVAARRRLAAKPPLKSIVETSAQLDPKNNPEMGVNLEVQALRYAAAHAYLKSIAK